MGSTNLHGDKPKMTVLLEFEEEKSHNKVFATALGSQAPAVLFVWGSRARFTSSSSATPNPGPEGTLFGMF